MNLDMHSGWENFKSFISRPIKSGQGLGEFAELAWFFILGFIIGFLFKYLGRLVLFGALAIVGSLWALSYFNLIVINMPMINDLGLNTSYIQNTLYEIIDWVRSHLLESLGLLAGFISAKILT